MAPEATIDENSADRLLRIVNRLPTKGNLLTAWMAALSVTNQSLEYYQAILRLESMVQEVERELAQVKMLHVNSATETLKGLRSLYITDNHYTPFDVGKASTRTAVIIGLGFIADMIRGKVVTEPTVPHAVVEMIKTKVDGLSKEISQASDIPDDLKRFWLVLLEKLRSSVATYEIFGIGPLRDEMGVVIARLRSHPETTAHTAEAPGWRKKLVGLVEDFTKVVEGAEKGRKALEWMGFVTNVTDGPPDP